jgi:sporulation protein YlmC with PRC-barrel domain
MLRLLEDLTGYAIHATDGRLGEVRDILFDDEKWAVRNLVLGTVGRLGGRSLLVSPIAIDRIDEEERAVYLSLTSKEVEDAPSLEEDPPVSRQQEARYYDHHHWPYYWAGPYTWGFWGTPSGLRGGPPIPDDVPQEVRDMQLQRAEQHDPHLRSFNTVNGYSVQASDGAMGDIEDMVYDDETWRIRYLVVDTAKYLPSKDVLVPPSAAERIVFAESKVYLDMTKDEISSRPAFRTIEDVAKVEDDVVVLNRGDA